MCNWGTKSVDFASSGIRTLDRIDSPRLDFSSLPTTPVQGPFEGSDMSILPKRPVNIDYGAPMADLMDLAKQTALTAPDFAGFGCHGADTHRGTHPLHRQLSIGLYGNPGVALNFRELLDQIDGDGDK